MNNIYRREIKIYFKKTTDTEWIPICFDFFTVRMTIKTEPRGCIGEDEEKTPAFGATRFFIYLSSFYYYEELEPPNKIDLKIEYGEDVYIWSDLEVGANMFKNEKMFYELMPGINFEEEFRRFLGV